jgi:hypothetical protein
LEREGGGRISYKLICDVIIEKLQQLRDYFGWLVGLQEMCHNNITVLPYPAKNLQEESFQFQDSKTILEDGEIGLLISIH